MLLVVDIGNTNIKLGLYSGKYLQIESRIATDRHKTADQFTVEMYTLFQVYKIDFTMITGCIIGSVVPQVTAPMLDAVKKLIGYTPLVVGPGIKTGLNIQIENPSSTGADLVAGCVAATAQYPCPCIVIGMGTATTISVINKDKAMIGGALMPGVAISLNALTSTSALLPSVSFDAPKNVIGKNTEVCIQSGVVLGNACMLDGMIKKIEAQLGSKCTVVATGGLSNTIVPNCEHDIILRDDLILEGLRIIYEKNVV